MRSLDNKTLDKIADIICGDKLSTKYCEDDGSDCPFYRKGYELSEFFQNAGLECENHDGTTRKWWTQERLNEYNDDPVKIKKVLLRIACPLEYHDINATNTVINALNNVIYAEGYEIGLNGTNPYLHEIKPTIPDGEDKKTITKVNFIDLVDNDPQLLKVLELRWKEIEICSSYGAYLSTIILLGSILEGLLLSIVEKNPKAANTSNYSPKDSKGKTLSFKRWTLNDLINVTHDCGWIDKDIKDFNSSLRDYRNLVHPRKQRDENVFPDEDTCRICVEVVRAALNDLKSNL
jgi:hypothetical protein